jgi:hypothetical protein
MAGDLVEMPNIDQMLFVFSGFLVLPLLLTSSE